MTTVLLFADGSRAIGAGHQVRCAAIADALTAQGARPVLVARDVPEATQEWAWAGREVHLVPATLAPTDAVAAACASVVPDVVVIDHYGCDDAGIAALGVRRPLALLDDLGERRGDGAALVINAAPGVAPEHHPRAAVALGPAWAPLRPPFVPGWRGGVGVAVLLGGTDAGGHATAAAEALLAAGERVVVVAPPSPVLDALVARHPGRCQRRHGVDAPEMAALLASCSAAVVSASTTAYEASCVGVPFVAVRVADNQRLVADGLRAASVVVLDPDAISAVAAAVVHARAQPARLAVDGRGAARIAERVRELAVPHGMLRQATWSDGDRLLGWANDPATRRASFSPAVIPAGEHRAWLARRLVDPETRLFIGEDAGAPVGTVRLQRDGRRATVSIAVAPEARGRGHGGRLLASLAAWCAATRFCAAIDAEVAHDNPASLALFRGAGWHDDAVIERGGRAALRLVREVA